MCHGTVLKVDAMKMIHPLILSTLLPLLLTGMEYVDPLLIT